MWTIQARNLYLNTVDFLTKLFLMKIAIYGCRFNNVLAFAQYRKRYFLMSQAQANKDQRIRLLWETQMRRFKVRTRSF